MIHSKCRGEHYTYKTPEGELKQVKRFPVPDSKVGWTVPWPEYDPVDFTAGLVTGAVWADPEIGEDGFLPKWNTLDGNVCDKNFKYYQAKARRLPNHLISLPFVWEYQESLSSFPHNPELCFKVNRMSHEGEYLVDSSNKPLNPWGRTGVRGRGVLGKWGPNHAADPVVTRWKMLDNGKRQVAETSGKPVLEFVCIQRRDTGVWAVPGGMVDPGEKVTTTVKREFMEEALDSTAAGRENVEELSTVISDFFDNGEEIYRGYVDDPRNTDNAWMETVVMHFHDETGEKVGKFPLQAGDDAAAICWMELSEEIKLYASHRDFVETVVKKLRAHW